MDEYRLDILSILILLYAVTAMLFLRTVIADPFVRDATDFYLLLTTLTAAFLPLLGGRGIFHLSPVFYPVSPRLSKRPRGIFMQALPALIVAGGLFSISLIEYVLTYGGFFPTLSFFPNLTPQILYGSGAAVEEFYFRFLPYVVLNRVLPGSLKNRLVYLTITAPSNSLIFTAYHLAKYGTQLALSIVFSAGMVFNISYRLRRLLWIPMLIHIIINLAAGPT